MLRSLLMTFLGAYAGVAVFNLWTDRWALLFTGMVAGAVVPHMIFVLLCARDGERFNNNNDDFDKMTLN